MALAEAIYSSLKENLADKKVTIDGKETALIEAVTGWYDKAEAAVKIQEANADLIKKRDALRGELEEIKKTVGAKDSEIEKLKTSQLSEDERKQWLELKGKGMTPDAEAKYNALEAKLNDYTQKFDEVTKKLAAEGERVKESTMRAADQELRNRAITELAKHKIEGGNAETALYELLGKKHLQIVEKDGDFISQIRDFKDGKELESTLDGVIKNYADSHQYLVTGTRNGGSGDNHQNSNSKSSGEPSVRDMLKMETGYDN